MEGDARATAFDWGLGLRPNLSSSPLPPKAAFHMSWVTTVGVVQFAMNCTLFLIYFPKKG